LKTPACEKTKAEIIKGEINRQVEARKRSNPAQQRHKITIEITNLITSRNLAVRRNDQSLAEDLNRQIIALGGDPQSGELVTLDRDEAERNASEYDDRIEKINENNKRKVREQMAKAHQGSLARKRAEEAIVREKQ
jgi:RNA polymerase-associated protein RTF1